jgi:hypothetical protein
MRLVAAILLTLLSIAAFGQNTVTTTSAANPVVAGPAAITSGTISGLSSPLGAADGGTGVANNAAATLTRSGNHALTITTTGTASLNVGTGGTLTNAAYACYVPDTAWTPAYGTTGTAFTSVTYDAVTAGRYTRIGSLVFVQGGIRTDAITVGSANGSLQITGLPFAARAAGSDLASRSGLSIHRIASFALTAPSAAEIIGGTTAATLYYRVSADGNQTAVPASTAVGTGADANVLSISGMYLTDAACP